MPNGHVVWPFNFVKGSCSGREIAAPAECTGARRARGFAMETIVDQTAPFCYTSCGNELFVYCLRPGLVHCSSASYEK